MKHEIRLLIVRTQNRDLFKWSVNTVKTENQRGKAWFNFISVINVIYSFPQNTHPNYLIIAY